MEEIRKKYQTDGKKRMTEIISQKSVEKIMKKKHLYNEKKIRIDRRNFVPFFFTDFIIQL